jgi:hypothetical protein
MTSGRIWIDVKRGQPLIRSVFYSYPATTNTALMRWHFCNFHQKYHGLHQKEQISDTNKDTVDVVGTTCRAFRFVARCAAAI